MFVGIGVGIGGVYGCVYGVNAFVWVYVSFGVCRCRRRYVCWCSKCVGVCRCRYVSVNVDIIL